MKTFGQADVQLMHHRRLVGCSVSLVILIKECPIAYYRLRVYRRSSGCDSNGGALRKRDDCADDEEKFHGV
jgi:hypothetical protein